MKLIASEAGRVTALYNADEFRPLGGLLVDAYLEAIADKYQFSSYPHEIDYQNPQPLVFENGRIHDSEQNRRINRMQLYDDGFQIDAVDTDLASAVLGDVVAFSQEKFQFRKTRKNPRLFYESRIVVEFDGPVQKTISAIDKICTYVSSHMSALYNQELNMEFNALAIASDPFNLPAKISNLIQADFSIVRRVNQSYEDNRYYSKAGVTTQIHLDFLEKFEELALE